MEGSMAILMRCRCGGQFKAKDEHAGKRFPCPKCGTTLEVPRASTPTPAAAATRPAGPVGS